MKTTEKAWQFVLLAAIVFYIFLRFWNLTDACLRFDEVFGVHAAELDWNALFDFIAQDLIHPPLFYVLLKIWIALGGNESLFALRFFPVFFSIIALVPFFLLCRRLKLDYATVALAVFLLAVNGALIKYAQEVRMYSLLMCFSLFSMWIFERFFSEGKNLIWLILINLLLVYTHYFGWFVVLSEITAIIIFRREKTRQIFAMFAVCLAAFAPWIFAVWQASRRNAGLEQNIGWINRPDFSVLTQFLFDLSEPFYFKPSSISPNSDYIVSIPILLILLTASAAFFFGRNNAFTANKRFYALAVFAALPVALVFAASWILPQSIWGTRHLIIVFAPVTIFLAAFLASPKKDWLKVSLIAPLFFFAGIAFIIHISFKKPNFVWCGWEKLASQTSADERRKIYVFDDITAYHLWFALRTNPERVEIVKIKNFPGITEDKSYFLPRGFDGVAVADESAIGGERFLIAFPAAKWSEDEPPVQNFLARGYRVAHFESYKAPGVNAYLVALEK